MRRSPFRVAVGGVITAIIIGVGTAVGVYEAHHGTSVPTSCTLDDARGCATQANRIVTLFSIPRAGSSPFIINCTGAVSAWAPSRGTVGVDYTITDGDGNTPAPTGSAAYPVLWRIADPTVVTTPTGVGVNIANNCNADDNTATRLVTSGNLSSGSSVITGIPDTSSIPTGAYLYAQNGTSHTRVLPNVRVQSVDSSSQVTVQPACSGCTAVADSSVTGARIVVSWGIDLVIDEQADGLTYGPGGADAVKTNGTARDINVGAGDINCGPKNLAGHQDAIQFQGTPENIGFFDVKIGVWDTSAGDWHGTCNGDGGDPFISPAVPAGLVIERMLASGCAKGLSGSGGSGSWGLIADSYFRTGSPPNRYTGGAGTGTSTTNGTTTISVSAGITNFIGKDDTTLGSGNGYPLYSEAVNVPAGTRIITTTNSGGGAGSLLVSQAVPSGSGAIIVPTNITKWNAALDNSIIWKGTCGTTAGQNAYVAPTGSGWQLANNHGEKVAYGNSYVESYP